MRSSSVHIYIHMYKNIYKYISVYYADTAIALVLQATHEEQAGNATISAAELDLEKEGRWLGVKTHQPQQTKTTLRFPAKALQ